MKKLVLFSAALMFNPLHAEDVVVAEDSCTEECIDFTGLYGGLGIGGVFLKTNTSEISINNVKLKDVKTNGFMATIALGGGKAFKGKFYLGGEVLGDFLFSGKKDIENVKNAKVGKQETSSIIPTLAARLGYVHAPWNMMVYLKPEISFRSVKTKDSNGKETFKTSKIAFSVGLGGEKFFTPKVSGRLEALYNFGKKDDFGTKINKGFAVRLMGTYHFYKFGA
ncbi:MAG: autotransporter outer membrane beta-barrel domain-containing protein [Holosporaceae bacterium]|jgi:outer membrane autotransporter protein|nr:autotransporter outer membrane beta-barrel domain-containing protein [Holosporaceae bacterium]